MAASLTRALPPPRSAATSVPVNCWIRRSIAARASWTRAIAAGGRVDFGPLRVDHVGRLTSLRDSLGALFVIMQPDVRQPGA